ncbi:MAG: HAD-IA family hydrolase, partial [Pseudomonadota bacterium]
MRRTSETTRIRGALFDKDGTLIDFAATWRGVAGRMIDDYSQGDAALADALGRAVGFDAATGVFMPGSPIVAGSTDEVARLMAALIPGAAAEEIESDANRRAAATGAGDGLTPVDGLVPTLERLAAMGLALGVGTHDSEAAARAHAGVIGAAPFMSFYAGYDSGVGLKPGPGMPQAFCDAAGLAPEEIVMVGDSLHDLGAGRSAGAAAVVAVLTGPATEAELARHADVVLPSVADLPDYLSRAFPA